MRIAKFATVVLACGALAACQDLTVDDVNRPSLEESLANAANIETSVGSAVKYWMGGQVLGYGIRQDQCCDDVSPAIAGMMDEITFGIRAGTLPPTTTLDEPRSEVDHHGAGFWVNRLPHQEAYTALAACHDIRARVRSGAVVWADQDRTMWMCKLTMGFAHMYLATMFNASLAVADDDEPIDPDRKDFMSHKDLMDFAVKQIREGIAEALAARPTTTLTTWINNQAYTNTDMAKVAYGYLARAEVWKASTPAEREDKSKGGLVDWTKVIQLVDSSLMSTWAQSNASCTAVLCNTAFTATAGGGIAGPHFGFKGDQIISGTINSYLYNATYSARRNYYRTHLKFLGPGDTTGAWENYRRTPIAQRTDTTFASPDKRLPLRAGARHVTTSTNTAYVEKPLPSDGAYFQLLASSLSLTANDDPAPTFRMASYQFIRFGDSDASRRSVTCSRAHVCNEFTTIMSPEELDLIKAEAYIRLGSPAAAVPLINKTRTAATKGALPAVGVAGPTQPYPQCVPHSWTDATKCGDLMDALFWEKKLETLGTDMWVNYNDWRAFGYLEPGSPVYWPIHSRELETLGIPYYSFGGSTPGSADGPACGSGTDLRDLGCVNYKSVKRLPLPPGT